MKKKNKLPVCSKTFSRYDSCTKILSLFGMLTDYLKTFFHYCLPKKYLTNLVGGLADVKTPYIKNSLIRAFIRKYNVNMQEALEEEPDNYVDFNAFFIRHLKPNCRPISSSSVISPVDGYISEIGNIHESTILQAKKREYSLEDLLACKKELSAPFNKGLFATLYLSPQDYHRIHMPIDATLKSMIYVPGKLFSVQPLTTRMIPRLFARNERLVIFFETAVGPMAMVLVGATIVGAIGTSWHGDITRSHKPQYFDYSEPLLLTKATEMGYFKLGSTVILLFADSNKIHWQPDLKAGDKISFGQPLAALTN